MTDDAYITNLVDATVAVDRALTAAEETAFLTFVLVGDYDGAAPADWLTEAIDADKYTEQIGKWWDADGNGDRTVAYLRTMHQLPKDLTEAILNAALYATFAMASATLTMDEFTLFRGRRNHLEIANGAALYARGYAEALGWSPQPHTTEG